MNQIKVNIYPTTSGLKNGDDIVMTGLSDSQTPTTGGLNEGKGPLGRSNDGWNPTTGGLNEGKVPDTSESNKGEDQTASGLKDGDDITMD